MRARAHTIERERERKRERKREKGGVQDGERKSVRAHERTREQKRECARTCETDRDRHTQKEREREKRAPRNQGCPQLQPNLPRHFTEKICYGLFLVYALLPISGNFFERERVSTSRAGFER